MARTENHHPLTNEEAKAESQVTIATLSAIGLVGILVVSLVVLLSYFESQDAMAGSEFSFEAYEVTDLSKPILQTRPEHDLTILVTHDKQVLSSYGWVDKEAGQVRIPIEDAMDLALKGNIFSTQ